MACLAASALAQQPNCFNNIVYSIVPQQLTMSTGDKYEINLDAMAIQNDIQFSYEIEPKDPRAETSITKVQTFNDPEFQIDINSDFKIQSCSDHLDGKDSNKIVLLCDSNQLLFLTLDKNNQKITEQEKVSLSDADLSVNPQCSTLKRAHKGKEFYTLCLNKDNADLLIYRTSLIDHKTRVFPFKHPKQLNLSYDLQGSVGQIDDTTILHVWDASEDRTKAIVKIFTDKLGQLKEALTLSSDDSENSLKAGSIKLLKHEQSESDNTDEIYLFTSTEEEGQEEKSIYMQRCKIADILGSPKATCASKDITKVDTGRKTVKLYKEDTNRFLYLFDNQEVSLATFDWKQESIDKVVGEMNTISIASVGFQKIHNIHNLESGIVIIGSTTDDHTRMDGVVKFKRNNIYFDSTTMVPIKSDFMFAHKEPLDKYDGWLLWTQKALIDPTQPDEPANQKLVFVVSTIKRNYLSISAEKDLPQEFTLKVKCHAKVGEYTFDQEVPIKVNYFGINEGASIKVPDLEAYAGTKSVAVPLSAASIDGNAAELNLIDHPSITAHVKHAESLEVVLDESLENIEVRGLSFVGDQIYAADLSSGTDFIFFKCITNSEKKQVNCAKVGQDISKFPGDAGDTTWTHVKSVVVEDTIVSLLTTYSAGTEAQNPSVRFVVQSTRAGKGEPQKQTYDNLIAYNREPHFALRKDGNTVTALSIRLNKDEKNTPKSIFKITVEDVLSQSPQFGTVEEIYKFNNEENFNPQEFKWAPRQSGKLFVASSERAGEQRVNKIFRYSIDAEAKEITAQSVIDVKPSKKFHICPQEDQLQVIYPAEGAINSYTFDAFGNKVSDRSLPLDFYGYTKIQDYYCDQNSDILQVIACTKEEEDNDCKLITYRGSSDSQNRRVHSIKQIKNAKNYPLKNFVASSFTENTDQALTIVAVTDQGQTKFEAFLMESKGPIVELNTEKVVDGSVVELSWEAVLPGKDEESKKKLPATSKITFLKQKTSVTVTPKDKNAKAKIVGNQVNLDSSMVIEGPYFKAQKANDDATWTLRDRVTEISTGVKPEEEQEFKRLIYAKNKDQDFVFSYIASKKEDTEEYALRVLIINSPEPNEPLTYPIKDCVPQDAILQSLYSEDHGIHFLAYIYCSDSSVQISWIKKDEGDANKYSVYTGKDEERDERMYDTKFLADKEGEIYLFGFNNENDYSLVFKKVTISNEEEKSLAISANLATSDQKLTVPIWRIEALSLDNLDQRIFLVIAISDYDTNGYFFAWSIKKDTVPVFLGSLVTRLVPEPALPHYELLVKCKQGESTSIDCFSTGSGLNSYYFNHEFEDIALNNLFRLKSSTLKGTFRNVANFEPLELSFQGTYASVVAENLKPNTAKLGSLGSEETNSLTDERFIAVLYNTESTVKVSDAGSDHLSVRYPYKIVLPSELHAQHTIRNLETQVCTDSKSRNLLVLSSAGQSSLYKVFEISPLTLVLSPEDTELKSSTSALSFIGVDGSSTSVKLGDFVEGADDDKKDDEKKKETPNHKAAWIITIIVIAVVALLVAGGVYVYMRRDSDTEKTLVKEDLEDSLHDNLADGADGGNASHL